LPWRLVGPYRLTPEPDGSPLFTLSPLVACQRYEPRGHPSPLALSRLWDSAFPLERQGRLLRSRSISGLFFRSLAFRPTTSLSTLRSGCSQTPRKTQYAVARLRLCRDRHPRRLNSTRLQGATLAEPDVNLSAHPAPITQPMTEIPVSSARKNSAGFRPVASMPGKPLFCDPPASCACALAIGSETGSCAATPI
jgi:hypothetical protein